MRKSQNKKVPQRIIAGVVLVGFVMMGLFYTTRRTQAGWYDDNWAYRKVINITGHTAEEKNVYLNLTGGSALDSQGASKTNCGDIRFTDANGKVLPYFIVSGCKTASTVVHIFFDTFPAGAQTIYYYYGNPSARDGFSLTDFSTAATGVTFGSYGSQEVGPGPVAYWKFDEGYGTVINSNTQSGTPMTLTVGSGAPWTTEERCISGKCLFFNATGNVAASTSISNIKTVQFWVKPKTNAGTLFDADGTASVAYIVATNGTITAPGFTSPSFYINGVYTTTPTLVANVWQHITVTTNSSLSFSALTMGELTGPPTFTGFIDEVKLYRTVRTASEIKSDAQRWAGAEGSSAIISSGQNANTTTPLSTGLVGYWKMDETSWTNNCSTATVMDASGNGTHGLSCPASTGPTGGTSGKYGNGALYDYVDNYISINNSTVYAPMNAPFSASAWVYLNSFSDQYPTILRLRSDDTQPWFIIFSNQTNYLGVSIGNNANFAGIKTDIPSSSLTGTWRHVVATYNGNGSNNINNFKIYLDGVLLTNSASGAYASHSQATTIGYNSSGNRWNGYIDEVRVYNRELNYNDARSLYYWAPGPVGYWKLDENKGTSASYDVSGNGLTANFTSITTDDWKQGKYGSALKMGDPGNLINVPFNSNLQPKGDMTIMGWVKFSQIDTSDFLFYSSDTYFLGFDSSDRIDAGWHNGTTWYYGGGTTSFQSQRWYHIAVVKSNSQLITYVDGVNDTNYSNTLTGTLNQSGSSLYLGSYYDSSQSVDGLIDELKIYNYARTNSQIIEDMNGGHPAPGSPVGSPLLHLSFEEGYGDTAYDSSVQLNHGNMSGSTTCPSASICPTWSNEGKFGKAMYFGALQTADGDSHIRLTNDKYDTLTEGALSFWFKSDGVGTDNDIFGAAEDDNGTGSDFVGVLFNAQDSMLNLGISNNGSLALNVVTQAIPNTTAWHHAVVNMSSSGHEIYVDGKKQTLTYLSGNSSTALWFDDIAENTTAYTVGCSDFDGSDTNDCNGNGFFAGTIDEFKLFTQPLTQEQINIEYNGGVSQSMGAASTTSDGVTSSNSSSREYCVPGDTGSCNFPILDLTMNENTGVSTFDSSGNNYVGSLIEGASWTRGKTGGGILLDGTNDQVDVSSFSYPTTDFTYQMWIRPNGLGTSNALISGSTASTGGQEFNIDTDTDGDIDVISNATLVINGTNGLIQVGKWAHVAVTRSGSLISLYVNGKLDLTGTDGVAHSFSSCALSIGVDRDATVCTNLDSWFDGAIDDVRIYNYARTPAQIAWDYNKGAPTHWYKFNECQGTTLYNSASTADGKATGLNGSMTLTGNSAGTCESVTSTDVWYIGENGKYGSAFGLDGNDYAVVATPALPTVDFTYATWIYVDTVNNDRPILKAADGAGGNEIKLEIMSDQGANPNKLRFAVDGTSIYSARAIQTGAWYHVVGRRTGSTMEMFINGQKDSVTGSDSTALSFSTCGLYIGAGPTSSCGGGISTYFDGMIDDLRIYNYALTDAQIKTVMNEGSAVRFGP